MALINRKTATLTDTLANKAAALRTKEQTRADLAASHLAAADRATGEQLTAAKHADAVEQAFAILDRAGVTV